MGRRRLALAGVGVVAAMAASTGMASAAGLPGPISGVGGTVTNGLSGTVSTVSAPLSSLSALGASTPLSGSLPNLGDAQVMGLASPGTSAQALIGIQHRNEAGLLRAIAAVSNPNSKRYGHYLTARQFDAAYAPSDATLAKVETYLTDFGLHVDSVPTNRAYVVVSGTVGQFSNAFATKIDNYIKAGQVFHAPVSPLSIPAALTGTITGVTGLDSGDILTPQIASSAATSTTSALPAPVYTPPSAAYVNAPPFSSYFNSSQATQAPGYGSQNTLGNAVQGYTPQQVEGAYGVSGAIASGLNGAGETVAVIDAYSSPTIVSDVDQWSAAHGLPKPDLTVNDNLAEETQPDGPTLPTDLPIVGGLNLLDPSGWFGEETLDIEAVHTMAPGAKIVMQGALGAEDIFLQEAQNKVVMADQAQEVSNSYAASADETDSKSDGYWEQAAMEGMGVQFSTGDEGDNTAGETDLAAQSVDGDPNSPYVTAVGGTSLAVGAQDNYEWETYWGTNSATLGSDGTWGALSFNSGGGGGVSQVYAEPDWQKGVVPDALANYWKTYTPQSTSDDAALTPCGSGSSSSAVNSCAVYPGRAMPDVAMLADPNTGFLMGQTQDYSVGSNPLSIPLATDDDHYGEYRIGGTSLASPLFAGMMALADQANGTPLGFADPALYALYSKEKSAYHEPDSTAPVAGIVRTNYTNSVDATGGTQTLLRTFANGYTLSTAAGYNDTTGLGSPDGMTFLCGLSANSALAQSVPGSPCAPASGGTPTSTGTTGANPGAGASSGTPTSTGTTGANPAPGASSGSGGSTSSSATPTTTGSSSSSGSATGSTPGAGGTKLCRAGTKISFLTHPGAKTRATKIVLQVSGHAARTLTAHAIKRFTIVRPTGKNFRLTWVTTMADGQVVFHRVTYHGCTRSKESVRVLHKIVTSRH